MLGRRIGMLGLIFAVASLGPGEFYVSGGRGASDANPGTRAAPWRTLQHAADQAEPGDTVWVMNGEYRNASPGTPVCRITKAGREGAWIRFRAAQDQQPQVRFDGWAAFQVLGPAAYIEIRGFTITGANDSIAFGDLFLEDPDPTNPRTNGIGISVDGRKDAVKPHHITIAQNIVRKAGAGIAAVAADYLTIEENVLAENAWYSAYAGSGIAVVRPADVDKNEGLKIVIRRNLCVENRCEVPWTVSGKVTDGNGIVLESFVTRLPNGKLAGYQGQTRVENNICLRNGGAGIRAQRAANVEIVNNTSVLNNQSPELDWGQISAKRSDNVAVLNNILVARPGRKLNDEEDNVELQIGHNLYFGSDRILFTGRGDKIGDPQLGIDVAGDSRLRAYTPRFASPAVDAGTSVRAATVDFSGRKRPIGKGVDIGAIEVR